MNGLTRNELITVTLALSERADRLERSSGLFVKEMYEETRKLQRHFEALLKETSIPFTPSLNRDADGTIWA